MSVNLWVPGLDLDEDAGTGLALVDVLCVFSEIGGAPIKQDVDNGLVTVLQSVRHCNVYVDRRRLPAVAAAELVLSINNHTKEIVQLEPGNVQGQVVVVEVLDVENVLQVPNTLEVRHELQLVILNCVVSTHITERLLPLPANPHNRRVTPETP